MLGLPLLLALEACDPRPLAPPGPSEATGATASDAGRAPGSTVACPGVPAAGTDTSLEKPIALADGTDVRQLGIDASYVYWTDAGRGTVSRVPKAGGRPETIAAGQENPQALVVDDEAAYWMDDTVRGALRRSLPGGGVRDLAPASQADAFSLAADDTYLYWTSFTTSVSRMPKLGGAIEPLAADLHGAQGISVQGDFLYWADYSDDSIVRLPKHPAVPDVLAQGATYHFPREAVADCDAVYFSVGNYGNEVYTRTLAPGSVRRLVDRGGSVVVDAEALYVRSASFLTRVELGSGRTTQLSDLPIAIAAHHGVAVDDQFVYFLADGGVWKRSKR